MKVDNPVCVRPARWCLDSCDTTSAAQMNSDELHLINRGPTWLGKTAMLPTENIWNGVQKSMKILVEHQCCGIKKRLANMRYHLTHQ